MVLVNIEAGVQKDAKESKMITFTSQEFLQWAKKKELSFVAQINWPDATKILPPDEVTTKLAAGATGHANLYTNAKKELFLTICLVSSSNQDTVVVFKQITSLK